MHDLAAQQVAGRSRMAGAFEEKPTEAKFVGIVGMYGGEKEEAGGWGLGQSSSLIKIFNTSERPRFDSLKEHRDGKKRARQLIVHPNQEEGVGG